MGTAESVAKTEPEADTVPGMEVAESTDAAAETAQWDTGASIHLRLFRAAHSIAMLEKDGEVSMGGKTAYGYISHDQTTMQTKKAFARHGIMVLPTVIEHSKDGNRTELTVECRFVNVDKPDDFVTVKGIGYGVDTSDKGPGKAFSYAMKYIYMKALMLNSADDIEADDIKHQPEVSQAHLAREAANTQQTKQAWATTYKLALQSAQSVSEIKELEKANRKELMSSDLPDVTREYFIELAEERKKELSE